MHSSHCWKATIKPVMKYVNFSVSRLPQIRPCYLAICNCVFAVLLCCQICASQNLVPNSSFETFSKCPPYLGQIHLADFWDSPNNNTTDYFHTCSPVADGVGVPDNELGKQTPATGEGYAGIRLWVPNIPGNPVYREYLAIELSSPLEAGKRYFARLKTSLAENSTFATDGLGMWLSDSVFSNKRVYLVQPQIANPAGNLLDDTEEWTSISGVFTALGGENYLMIGNFQTNEDMVRVELHKDYGPVVYYYIDDVEVSACPETTADTDQVDTVLCQGASLQLSAPQGLEYRWNDGSTRAFIMVDRPGEYTVVSKMECREYSRQFRVTQKDCTCAIFISDLPNRQFQATPAAELCDWQVYDMAGRLLAKYPNDQILTFLPSGLYVFRAVYRCLETGELRNEIGQFLVWQ